MKLLRAFILSVLATGISLAQQPVAMIGDTQAPLWIEKIIHKTNHNEHATAVLAAQILALTPRSVFITGDVTARSAAGKKWRAMDGYLKAWRAAGIPVYALMGNHDVMGSAKKGESKFKKRFPDAVSTGYYHVVDSMAFVLLNSNFKKMTGADIELQQRWYLETLVSLNGDPGVKAVIVSCHHAPYSNSKVVGSSKPVQEHFVPAFLSTPKCRLFITGHSHSFEHFNISGKDFLVIGGGGGIHQPLTHERPDLQPGLKPLFHFITITRIRKRLTVECFPLTADLAGGTGVKVVELATP